MESSLTATQNAPHLSTEGSHGSRLKPDAWTFLAAAVAIVALAVSVWPHIDRPIWADEAWMVHAAHESTTIETLGRMTEWKMPGAVGYVAVLKGSVELFPGQIAPMRMISLISAAVVIIMIGVWLGRLVQQPTVGMALATTLVASYAFQRFSTEIKQYMLAAALSLCLIEAMQQWLRFGSRRAAGCWFGLALLGVLFTYAVWFAIAATVGVAGIWFLYRKDWTQVRRLTLLAGGVMVVALVIHLQYNANIASGSANLNRYLPGGVDKGVSIPTRMHMAADAALGVFWGQHPLERSLPLALLVPVGFAIWLWRQPVTALLSFAMVAVAVAANAVGKWALWLRMNLPIMAMIHLCLLAMPIAVVLLVFSIKRRRKSSDESTPPPLMPTWVAPAGLVLAIAFGFFGVYESRTNGYQPHAVEKLLLAVADDALASDLVILDIATVANQHYVANSFATRTLLVHWPSDHSLRFLRSIHQRTLITVSLHNHSSMDSFARLKEQVADRGELKLAKQLHMAALFEYVPYKINSPMRESIQP